MNGNKTNLVIMCRGENQISTTIVILNADFFCAGIALLCTPPQSAIEHEGRKTATIFSRPFLLFDDPGADDFISSRRQKTLLPIFLGIA